MSTWQSSSLNLQSKRLCSHIRVPLAPPDFPLSCIAEWPQTSKEQNDCRAVTAFVFCKLSPRTCHFRFTRLLTKTQSTVICQQRVQTQRPLWLFSLTKTSNFINKLVSISFLRVMLLLCDCCLLQMLSVFSWKYATLTSRTQLCETSACSISNLRGRLTVHSLVLTATDVAHFQDRKSSDTCKDKCCEMKGAHKALL